MKQNQKKLTGQNESRLTRRGLMGLMGSAGFASALGMPVPFAGNLASGLLPVALADDGTFGKDGLTLLGDRPLNMETPPHLLDDKITPGNRLFVRNNGIPPELDDERGQKLETYHRRRGGQPVRAFYRRP